MIATQNIWVVFQLCLPLNQPYKKKPKKTNKKNIYQESLYSSVSPDLQK